jgi:membrane-associated phospholipid phosphatase
VNPRHLVPARVRRALPLLVVATVVWVGGLGAIVAGRTGNLWPDGPIDRAISSLDNTFHTPAQGVANMASASHFTVLLILMLAACTALRSARAAADVVVGIGVVLVITEVLKREIARRMLIPGYMFVSGYTFPSGHTAVVSVIATVAVLVVARDAPLGRRLGERARQAVKVASVALVVLVGGAMIMIRDHYFTDVIAAVPLGVTTTLLVSLAVDLIFDRVGRI